LPYSEFKPRRKKAVAELKFCDTILKELMKKSHEVYAFPFYNPVDPVALNIPDYFRIIRKPMDLGTITTKLKANEYDGVSDFEADIRQMFFNCYKFNPPDSAVYGMGKKLEAVFDSKWRDKPNFKEQQSESVSPQPEEHEEDVSDDDNDYDEENVVAMQQQLEEMQRRLEKMKKSKKNSPPVQDRGHKKRNSVSAASAPVPKKSSTKKKSSSKKKDSETPYITFEQKQELSERINTLSQNKVAQCLKMIQENMPQLSKVSLQFTSYSL